MRRVAATKEDGGAPPLHPARENDSLWTPQIGGREILSIERRGRQRILHGPAFESILFCRSVRRQQLSPATGRRRQQLSAATGRPGGRKARPYGQKALLCCISTRRGAPGAAPESLIRPSAVGLKADLRNLRFRNLVVARIHAGNKTKAGPHGTCCRPFLCFHRIILPP